MATIRTPNNILLGTIIQITQQMFSPRVTKISKLFIARLKRKTPRK